MARASHGASRTVSCALDRLLPRPIAIGRFGGNESRGKATADLQHSIAAPDRILGRSGHLRSDGFKGHRPATCPGR